MIQPPRKRKTRRTDKTRFDAPLIQGDTTDAKQDIGYGGCHYPFDFVICNGINCRLTPPINRLRQIVDCCHGVLFFVFNLFSHALDSAERFLFHEGGCFLIASPSML